MESYFRFILRHRIAALVVILLITVAAGAMIRQGVVASTMGGMFLAENPAYKRYLERITQFGNNEFALFVFPMADPLSADSQKKLRAISEGIQRFDEVRSVRTILDAQHICREGDDLKITPYAQEAKENPGQADELLRQMISDPLVKGLFLSKSGADTGVVVELKTESDFPAEKAPELINGIYDIFEKQGVSRKSVHGVGPTINIAAVIEQTQFNLMRLFPLVCLALLIAVWILFRRLWPVLLTLSVSMIGVVWTMGFSVLLDRHITILASMVPPVILIISFSDVIHLTSAYLLELAAGREKNDAILASGVDVGKACFLTSVTTLLGFVAMSFVPAPVFRQLGLVLGFGVSTTLLVAVTLVPIIFSFVPQPRQWRVGSTGKVQNALDTFLEKVASFSTRRAGIVTGFFIVVILVSIGGLFFFNIETDFAKRVGEKHQSRVDSRYFQQHFAGANLLDIYIETAQKEGLLDPDLFAKIAAFQKDASALKGVENSFSLVDLIGLMHDAVSDTPGALPDSRQALAQYLLLFEMSDGQDLDRWVNFRRDTMRITLQMPGEAVRETWKLGQQVQHLARERFEGEVLVESSGLMYLMGGWFNVILKGQRRGLIFAFVTVAIVMIIGLRSIRAGLWSMIPNALPILFLAGYLGYFWDQVDSDLLGLMMIAIGIGVDDTIHFLTRFRIESKRSENIEQAVKKTFHFSGRGIVMTTIILVVGFAPLALSDYLSIKVMGTLLPMTLIVALVADLFFVPALVKLKAIKF